MPTRRKSRAEGPRRTADSEHPRCRVAATVGRRFTLLGESRSGDFTAETLTPSRSGTALAWHATCNGWAVSRAWVPLLLVAWTSSAQAEQTTMPASTHGSVGLESQATRYGTSYETVYQLSLVPSARLRLDALELSAILPLSASATAPTYCCRTTLGNATFAAAYRGEGDGLRLWSEISISAPTSYWSDAHASSLAATAALMHDAGHYLPSTTTLRVEIGGELHVGRWLWLGASAGAHHWLRHAQQNDALVLPLEAYALLPWEQAWAGRVAFRTLARVYDSEGLRERYLHEISTALVHEWHAERVELSLSVPLDESLRELEMLGLGAAYARRF
jgi:hypothetical protein